MVCDEDVLLFIAVQAVAGTWKHHTFSNTLEGFELSHSNSQGHNSGSICTTVNILRLNCVPADGDSASQLFFKF